MSPREQRAAMARETLAIVAAGRYVDDSGHSVDIAASVQDCLAATRLLMPEQVDALVAACEPRPANATSLAVRNENSLTALARAVAAGHRRVGVLNFASAHNPGGGFERGAQAQEEALARSSALYASLVSPAGGAFYRHEAGRPSSLYTDRVIVSPDCPVFRDADGRLLAAAIPATFLTCAAPNASALRTNAPAMLSQLPETFERRAAGVLAAAADAGCDALVLGAWGCGVFGNDPALVAGVFASHVNAGGRFAGRFERIDFAVLDASPDRERLTAFERAFAGG